MSITINKDEHPTDGDYLILSGYSFNNRGKPTSVNVYRLYNRSSSDHFFTTDVVERNSLISSGWVNEGIAFSVTADASIPVYSYYNSKTGHHAFTTSEDEKDALVAKGYEYEKERFKIDSDGNVNIYRLINQSGDTYHMTIDLDEYNRLIKSGWCDAKALGGKATAEVYTVDLPGNRPTNGNILHLWPYNGSDAQVWHVETIKDGLQRIMNRSASNMGFDCIGGWWDNGLKSNTYRNGQQVGLYHYFGAGNELFTIARIKDKDVTYNNETYHTYKIIATDGAKKDWDVEILDDGNNYSNDIRAGSKLSLSSYDETGLPDDHYWIFVPLNRIINGRVYSIRPFANPEMKLQAVDTKTESNVNIYASNNDNKQYWSMFQSTGGKYILHNVGADKYLDVPGDLNTLATRKNGTNVQISDLYDQTNQTELWDVLLYSDTTYIDGKKALAVRFSMTAGGKVYCMDNSGNQTRNNNNVQMYENNSSAAQRWWLVEEEVSDPNAPIPYDLCLTTQQGTIQNGNRQLHGSSLLLYPAWKSSAKWGNSKGSVSYRWRRRYLSTDGEQWTEWSDYYFFIDDTHTPRLMHTGWSNTVALTGNADSGLAIDAWYDIDAFKNCQYELDVKTIGVDAYGRAITGGTTVAYPYVTWTPTIDFTVGGVTPEGLHLEMVSDYGDSSTGRAYGPTYVYINGVYTSADSTTNLLQEPYKVSMNTLSTTVRIAATNFKTLPNSSSTITIEYQVGNDQCTQWLQDTRTDSLPLTMTGTTKAQYEITAGPAGHHSIILAIKNPLGSTSVQMFHNGKAYSAYGIGNDKYEIHFPFAGNFDLNLASENQNGSSWYQTIITLNADILRTTYKLNIEPVHVWFDRVTNECWCIEVGDSNGKLVSNHTIDAVYETNTVNTRDYEMVTGHKSRTGEFKVAGTLLYSNDLRDKFDDAIRTHETPISIETIVGRHLVYIDTIGHMTDVYVSKIENSNAGHNTASVSITMTEESR